MFKQYILALSLLISAAVPSFAWDIDKMNNQIEKTNVIVSEICSGTIIDKEKRLVLTANHCITDNLKEVTKQEVDPKTGEIRTKKVMEKTPMFIEKWKRQDFDVVTKEMHYADILCYDSKIDVAILRVTDRDWRPDAAAPFAPDSYIYKRGLPVYAVGNPGISYDDSVTTGIISAPYRKETVGDMPKMPFFQHSASIIGGSSGGAIYNDAGEIIGTVSAGIRGANLGLAVPIEMTKKLLATTACEVR